MQLTPTLPNQKSILILQERSKKDQTNLFYLARSVEHESIRLELQYRILEL
jgi:hypothetical protein